MQIESGKKKTVQVWSQKRKKVCDYPASNLSQYLDMTVSKFKTSNPITLYAYTSVTLRILQILANQ